MKELDKIIKTEKELTDAGYVIKNSIIEDVGIRCVGHFNNTVSFEIGCSNVVPYSFYNNTANVGYVFKAFIELFDLTEDDGVLISEIKNIPCRVVYDKKKFTAVGIGHFMRNRFVFIEDLAMIG